jgi:hypothetical protein
VSGQLLALASLIERVADALALMNFCDAQIARANAIQRAQVERMLATNDLSIDGTQAFIDATEYPMAWKPVGGRDAIIAIWDCG